MIKKILGRFSPLLLLLILAACGNLSGEVEIVGTVAPPTAIATEAFQLPENSPNIANGAVIFQANCTRCHGINGTGNGELVASGEVPRMASFLEATHVRQQSLESYYNIITNGNIVNLMPPWSGSLSVQERWDVTAYVYSLHYTPEQIAQGESLARTVDGTLRRESDNDLAVTTGLSSEDAFAVVAYQRMQSFVTSAVAPEATEAPTASFSTVTIRGTVSHGTAGKTVPLALPVQLRYGNATTGVQILTAYVDTDNRYIFTGVPFDPSFEYFTAVTYQERGFISPLVGGRNLQAENELNIVLYDIVPERSAVSMTGIDFEIDALTVAGLGTGLVINQTNAYFNGTDRMFLTKPDTSDLWVSLLMQLPVGATILNSPNDPRFIQAPEQYALIDLQPVYPGQHIIAASYFMPYVEGRTIDIPVNNRLEGNIDILVREPELSIRSEAIRLVEEVNLGTEENPQMAKIYSGSLTLEIGESLIFDIDGVLPQESTTNSAPVILTQDQWLPLVIMLVIVAAGLGIGLFFGLRARAASPQAKINRLLSQITQLEDLHKAGSINHDAYQNQVKALKAELAKLMAEQKQS